MTETPQPNTITHAEVLSKQHDKQAAQSLQEHAENGKRAFEAIAEIGESRPVNLEKLYASILAANLSLGQVEADLDEITEGNHFLDFLAQNLLDMGLSEIPTEYLVQPAEQTAQPTKQDTNADNGSEQPEKPEKKKLEQAKRKESANFLDITNKQLTACRVVLRLNMDASLSHTEAFKLVESQESSSVPTPTSIYPHFKIAQEKLNYLINRNGDQQIPVQKSWLELEGENFPDNMWELIELINSQEKYQGALLTRILDDSEFRKSGNPSTKKSHPAPTNPTKTESSKADVNKPPTKETVSRNPDLSERQFEACAALFKIGEKKSLSKRGALRRYNDTHNTSFALSNINSSFYGAVKKLRYFIKKNGDPTLPIHQGWLTVPGKPYVELPNMRGLLEKLAQDEDYAELTLSQIITMAEDNDFSPVSRNESGASDGDQKIPSSNNGSENPTPSTQPDSSPEDTPPIFNHRLFNPRTVAAIYWSLVDEMAIDADVDDSLKRYGTETILQSEFDAENNRLKGLSTDEIKTICTELGRYSETRDLGVKFSNLMWEQRNFI